GVDHPHAAPLRRDRPAETVAAHRDRAPPLHGRRRRPLAAGAVAAAARLLPGGGLRLPGPAGLFAAGGDPPARRAPAGTDRVTAEAVRAARSAGRALPPGGGGLRRRVSPNH